MPPADKLAASTPATLLQLSTQANFRTTLMVAVKLLEAKLEIFPNVDTNHTFSAALNDIGKFVSSLGFAIKADSCFTKALLIKHRAQQQQPKPSSNIREEQNHKRLSENSKETAASEPSTSSDKDW